MMKFLVSSRLRYYKKYGINVLFPENNQTSFTDIIDLETQKEELLDILAYLRNKADFLSMGIKPHLRFIFFGAKGTGKKSLAKALAKEANIPLVFVNVSRLCDSSRMDRLIRIVFDAAQFFYPCILFLNELDDIAGMESEKRSMFAGLLRDELLANPETITIMSISFSQPYPICLFTTGAFEKTLVFHPPEVEYREKLLKKFCKNLPLAKEVSLDQVARDTIDLTGGEILGLVQDTALLVKRKGHSEITYSDFVEVLSIMDMGYKKRKLTDKEKRSTAYHEVGHVVAGYFSDPENFELSRVEIIPRADSLGYTLAEVDEDKRTYFKNDLESRIIRCFGGMAAEEVFYETTSSGVVQDLSMATSIAASMVEDYGMSEKVGHVSTDNQFRSNDFNKIIEFEIKEILDKLYTKTVKLIQDYRQVVVAIADALLEKEILYGHEVKAIIQRFEKK